MAYNRNNPIDNGYLLLNKETKEIEGRIEWYWTKNYVLHLKLDLYEGNSLTGRAIHTTGRAVGGGYDMISAGINSALGKENMVSDYETLKAFTFGHKEDGIFKSKKVPVYAGAGNQVEALGIFFSVRSMR